MPTNDLTNVKNWPNVIFNALLTVLGGLIFMVGTGLYNEVKELNSTIIEFNSVLSGTIKDYGYLKAQVDKLEVKIDKHIEASSAEKRELSRDLEALKYQLKIKQ